MIVEQNVYQLIIGNSNWDELVVIGGVGKMTGFQVGLI